LSTTIPVVARPPRVALVQPPFGSGVLPGLGLPLLNAELKARGIESRIFYWDLDLLESLPGRTPRERYQGFSEVTSGPWFPFNEWVFARAVHDDRLDSQAEATRHRLLALGRRRRKGEALAQHLLQLREDVDAVLDRIADALAGYDVIGLGSTFFQNTPALALARRVKTRWPEKTVVMGGANCDGGMGAALVEHFPFLDHVFAGEVDLSFPAFVEQLRDGRRPDVPGLVSRGRDGKAAGTPAPPLGNLDLLQVPDYTDYVEAFTRVGLDSFLKLTLSLESSRGCWWGEHHHCLFCGLNAGGMAFRRKQPDRFAWEVEEIVRRHGVRFVYMADNILATDYGGFLERMQRAGHGVDFFYEIKSNVTRKQVSRLAGARVSYIKPGIEHFSSAILTRMRKGVTGIQNVALLRLAREHGILVDYAILVGFPGEETEEYDRLARQVPLLSHLRPPVAVTPVEFHRFSPYHSDPAAFGLRLRPRPDYATLYPLPETEIARLAYVFETSTGVPEDRGYLKALLEQVRRWLALYNEARCTLTASAAGGDLAITDWRPGFGPRRPRLRGFAAELLRRMDEPRTLSSLLRSAGLPWTEPAPGPALEPDETLVEFTREAFLVDPDACLWPLREAGLVFEEQLAKGPSAGAETYLLSLPVPSDHRPANLDWLVY
jgi:ribosomal peptide maturation radical SAM protein 1